MKIVRKIPTFFNDVFCFAKSSKRCLTITIQTLICLLLCIVSLGTFLYLTDELFENDLTHFDLQFSRSVYESRTPGMTEIMMFISSIGSGFVIFIISVICIVLLIKKHKKEAVLFCITLLIGALLNSSIKLLIQRQRPQIAPLIVEKTFSFPSGHAMNSFIFFSLLSYFSFHFFRNKKITVVITCFSVGAILIIGYSRIYLGVHYFSDVMAGYIAGFWWFITVLLIDRALIFYKLFKQSD